MRPVTRAYAELRKDGRFGEAVKIAVWLAREYRGLYRNDVAADGWLARAQSMADRSDSVGDGDGPTSQQPKLSATSVVQ
ncbi:hypothetical protein OH805_17745 [Streptomyces sp. NBC_00879]|uniref:hypothetical protein n=1 Tax=Streptomyces sp. NBC_00879 TaxID=2975855 RepID=UPI003864985E|nr:hypothetical protein OH805_17745 [Streptomyces sp. NBC_00879]